MGITLVVSVEREAIGLSLTPACLEAEDKLCQLRIQIPLPSSAPFIIPLYLSTQINLLSCLYFDLTIIIVSLCFPMKL